MKKTMSIITSEIKDGVLYLYAHGRVDSGNASACEAEISTVTAGFAGTKVIMDVDDLQYISSAGLRVILKLRKEKPDLKIVNANSDIYEIFEMTGFSEIIPVEKAYRKLSVDGCEIIGKGANGAVYRLDPDTIIKVYLNPDSLPDIHRERELARRAFVLGIPTAIPYDVVRVGEGYGSVFELLNAKSLANLLQDGSCTVEEAVKMFVDLLKKIHSTQVKPEDMPDQRQVVLNWVKFLKDYLPAEKWEKLNALVEAVPVSHCMNHGDYHIKNVMLQNGEVLLIDMDTLCQGDPVFEFASIFNAFRGFSELDHENIKKFLGIDRETALDFWYRTIKMYFNTDDPAKISAVEDKSALIGYTRLLRRTIRRHGLESEEGKKQIGFYKGQILELLDRIDTLTF